jgi:hypothetical protein
MKRLYNESSTRIFVVTMSQIVGPLRGTFKEWRNTIASPRERPVLVVTVASVPGRPTRFGDCQAVRQIQRRSE